MTSRSLLSISRRKLVVLALLLLSTIVVLLLCRPPVKAEAQILPMPEKPPTYPSNPLDRWIPMKWGWLWKIRYAIFGYNPSIHLDPIFADLSKAPEDAFALLPPSRPPLAQTNGVRVWVLPPEEYRAAQMRLQSTANITISSGCRVTTGPWVQANCSSGWHAMIGGTQRWLGLNLNIYTRLNGKAVDLTALFTASEVTTNSPPPPFTQGIAELIEIQTNLSLAARFVIPESNGVFVLDSSRFATEHRRTAISIAPRVEPYQSPARKK